WDRRELQCRLTQDRALDSIRGALGQQRWLDAHSELSQHFATAPRRFPVHRSLKGTIVKSVRDRFPEAALHATSRADRIADGAYDLLGYRELRFASEESARGTSSLPDWHVDSVHGRRAPRRFWTTINYLDPEYGDHKIVWELNRHQHWIALGRAYWL